MALGVPAVGLHVLRSLRLTISSLTAL